jgi:transposase InsO family protein
VISARFLKKLGLTTDDLRPLETKAVGTAKANSSLRVLGETKQILRLKTLFPEFSFEFQPAVVEGMSMDVNISGPWMKAHKWDQLHSEDCVHIQGYKIPLRRPCSATPGVATMYVAADTVVPKRSMVLVKLKVPDVERGRMPTGLYYLRGEEDFRNRTEGHPALNIANRCDEEGITYSSVLNSTSNDLTLSAGTRYGTCEEVDLLESKKEFEFKIPAKTRPRLRAAAARIAAVGRAAVEKAIARSAPTGRTTAAADMDESAKFKDDPAHWPKERREKWLLEKFQLKDKPCLRTPQALRQALDLLLSFWTFFSHDGSSGKTHLMKHRIITEDVPPIKNKYKPVNPTLEGALKKQIDDWLEQDVISPSNSPWSANLVAVRKKNGKIRWCQDYRRLNEVTKKDSYPMPSVKDNITRLAGSTIFSAVDMQGAFHCIEIDPRDREKTAFSTPFGQFEQKRLGFGLTNGPSAYCRLVDEVLRNIPSSVAVGFLDDAVIHSSDFETHLEHLKLTLSAYRDAGLKLSPDKCVFFADSIDYLGHRLDANGIRPMKSHIEVITKWPVPKLKTEARAFLGLTGYYREHIRDYAAIAKPWTDVMGKTDKEAEKLPLEVTPEMISSFEKLKKLLTSRPILGFPYFKGPKAGQFILDTDFCKAQIAGVLSQVQNGKEVVIAYGSRKLRKHQQNWPSTKGELYAGIYFMDLYRYYLQFGPTFLWRTDNEALKWVKSLNCPSSIIERWLATLADFDFEVQHRKGSDHGNADGLSRSNAAIEITSEEDRPTITRINPIFRNVQLFQHSREELRALQEEDEDLKIIISWLRKGEKPDYITTQALSELSKLYLGLWACLSLDEHGLLRYQPPNQNTLQPRKTLVLPSSLWEDTIRMAHATGGHMALDATLARLQKVVYLPHMRAEVQQFIRNCDTCQTKLNKQPQQRHTLVSHLAGYPFQRLHIDFVGKLPPGKRTGAQWLLTIKDNFSKWVEAIPIPGSPTAEATVRALEKEVFCRYGYPETIHSDCGQQFTSQLFKEVAQMCGIQVTTTTGYNPKSNGVVERMHKDLAPMLKALMEEQQVSWEDALPQALFALRTTPSASTGLTPYQILFGREVSQPLDLIFGNPSKPPMNEPTKVQEYLRDLRSRIDKAQTFARQHLADAVKRRRRQYKQEKKEFTLGQKVWLFTPASKEGVPRKLSNYWTGPWTICHPIPTAELLCRIAPHPDWTYAKGSIVVSIDRLKLFHPQEPNTPPTEDADLLMEGDEFAQNIELEQRRPTPTPMPGGNVLPPPPQAPGPPVPPQNPIPQVVPPALPPGPPATPPAHLPPPLILPQPAQEHEQDQRPQSASPRQPPDSPFFHRAHSDSDTTSTPGTLRASQRVTRTVRDAEAKWRQWFRDQGDSSTSSEPDLLDQDPTFEL